MSDFAVLRVGKLKGWGSVSAAGSHNMRLREVPNADPSRADQNRVLVGGEDLPGLVKARLDQAGITKWRKDAVLCSEMILTASPEAMEAPGFDVAAWAKTNETWLRERYGANLVQAVLHLDEKTPHIHAAVVPITPAGSLSAKTFWGERAGLHQLQTDYAEAMKQHGLRRGIEKSRAKHTSLKRFYGVLEAAQAEPKPDQEPLPPRPRAEEQATLGWVKASTVADAERRWRAVLRRWAKRLGRATDEARAAAKAAEALRKKAEEQVRRDGVYIAELQRQTRLMAFLEKHAPEGLEALLRVTKAKVAGNTGERLERPQVAVEAPKPALPAAREALDLPAQPAVALDRPSQIRRPRGP